MIIIHGVQKLLNTSRLKPVLYISGPSENQHLHSWYARLLATGITGKLMVMYVHQPSLITILCKGKTIQATWAEFGVRLPLLLIRFHFPKDFIEREMQQMNGYVVSKTNSKSMLAFMNQMVVTLEHHIGSAESYDTIPQQWLEDLMMKFSHKSTGSNNYITPKLFWKETLGS